MKWLCIFVVVLLVGCGSKGSGDNDDTAREQVIVPDVVVFFISGHTEFDGEPSYSYLHTTAGPNIVADLIDTGYTVEAGYYVDDAFPVKDFGGFQELVEDMSAVRDRYVPYGTRVIVIAHSHGEFGLMQPYAGWVIYQ